MSTVLHVGCARSPAHELFAGWDEIRLDMDASVNPDIVAPMTAIPLPDGSVDAIYTSHTLEHVYHHEGQQALREFLRVLKPGGFAVIVVPDIGALGDLIKEGRLYDPLYDSPGGQVCAADMIWGHQGWVASEPDHAYRYAHRFGYTADTLETALIQAGFTTVRTSGDDAWNLVAVATALASG